MTCDAFQAELSALLDGALPPHEASAIEAHLADCGACQAERDAIAQVSEQVGNLPRISAPPEFAAGLWARVQTEEESEPATRQQQQAGVLVAKAVKARPTATAEVPVLPTGAETAPDSTCAPFAVDVSALLDRALPTEREQAVRAHLAECVACTELGIDLQRVRDRVGSLIPLRVPPEFVRTIMDAVESIEREKVDAEQAARAARAKWFVTLGKLAQAAALLFVVGGGVMFSTPKNTYRRSLPGFSSPSPNARALARNRARSLAAKNETVDQAPAPLPAGDAQWELAVTSVKEGEQATRALLGSFGRHIQTRAGERSYGFFADVPRNQVDDLHRGLTSAPAVQTSAQSEEAMRAIHAEQDQVVLKSGFVLVGQLLEHGNVIRLRSGRSTIHTIPSKDVERVERAAEPRSLRILLHQQD